MQKYFQKFDISIIAYCLMPNHYHFLVRQNSDKSISDFIQAVFNSYTKAFNKRYNRSGPLFEGRFRSIEVDEQDYLIHLCAYIHLNPRKAGLRKKLGDWPYSNLPEWLELRKGQLFEKSFRDQFFKTPKRYLDFLTGYNLPQKGEKYLFD